MSPQQQIFAGSLEEAYQAELARLSAVRAIEKMWRREPDLWKSEPEHARVIANRLGWLDSPVAMRGQCAALAKAAREARDDGFRDMVLLGMGGSSLAPEVFSLVFPPPSAGARFFVLDSTDPASVLGVERAVELKSTLFIVASKSGSTIETLSQFRYFHERVAAAGVSPAGRNFVAITDAGSSLDKLASELRFRQTWRNPADIGGRYSAISYFGLYPAALWGVDLEALLDLTLEMRAACSPDADSTANPALALGALLGAGAQHGVSKVALLATPTLASLGNWIEQLVAESTGKEGKGIIPIAGEAPGPPDIYEGTTVVALGLAGDERGELDALIGELRKHGTPVVVITLARREQLAGEFFKWEVATGIAGAVLGVNPFDEPNVTESKDNTARILSNFKSQISDSGWKPAFTELGITVSAPPGMSAAGLTQTLGQFFSGHKREDYAVLLAFVDRSAENAHWLDAMRLLLRDALRQPVLLGYGPRYLHSIGQLYKGGPPTGKFLLITAADEVDAAIPGAGYGFSQLKMAQALGDLQSIASRKKPALHLHLTQGAAAGLARLDELLLAAGTGEAQGFR